MKSNTAKQSRRKAVRRRELTIAKKYGIIYANLKRSSFYGGFANSGNKIIPTFRLIVVNCAGVLLFNIYPLGQDCGTTLFIAVAPHGGAWIEMHSTVKKALDNTTSSCYNIGRKKVT